MKQPATSLGLEHYVVNGIVRIFQDGIRDIASGRTCCGVCRLPVSSYSYACLEGVVGNEVTVMVD